VASNLSMRLHGVNAFNAFPMLVRTGGMINAFGPSAGKKLRHPDTGEITMTARLLVTMTTCVKWPRTPQPMS